MKGGCMTHTEAFLGAIPSETQSFGFWYSRLNPDARRKFAEMTELWIRNCAVADNIGKLMPEFRRTGDMGILMTMDAIISGAKGSVQLFKQMEKESGFNLNWCSTWPPHVNQETPGDIFIKLRDKS